MKDVLAAELQNYLISLLPALSEVAEEQKKEAEERHIPIVEDEVANLLGLLVQMANSEHILEIGTAIGRSAVAMAEKLPAQGRLLTIEMDEDRYKRAQYYFQKSGLGEKIEPVLADAREYLPHLAEEKPKCFDFIFLDAAKGQYLNFFPFLDKMLALGGLIVADNVLLNGWVVDLSYPNHRRKTFVYRMREFLEGIKSNTKYDFSLIPLGDGVLILRKKEN